MQAPIFKTGIFPERRAIVRVKTISYLAAGVILAAAAATGQAQTAFSLSVGSPGFYGAIDVGGGAPPPALVYAQPIAVQPVVVADPLYLYVPPDQYANWGLYCGYYNACNRSVYFVDSGWYQRRYVPYYRSHRHVYEGRRADFDRHVYRPPPRNADRLPLRPDARRGPEYRAPEYRRPEYRAPEHRAPEYRRPEYRAPEHRAPEYRAPEHRNPPAPRPESRPPVVRPESHGAPVGSLEARSQIRTENRSAPAGRPSGNSHSGQEHRGRN